MLHYSRLQIRHVQLCIFEFQGILFRIFLRNSGWIFVNSCENRIKNIEH